jgi:hypothetical protein
MYENILSPMTLRQSVADFIQSVQSGGQGGRRDRNMLMQQRIMSNVAEFDSSGVDFGPTLSASAEGMEDLYLYRRDNVSLERGARGRYVLFSSSVPYEHVYELNVPDSMNIDERGYQRGGSGQPEGTEQVWHVLRLKNETAHPWTTAPVLVINNDLPVAQSTIGYTSLKGSSKVKMTVATDVRADHYQTEESRQVVDLAGDDFEKIVVNGNIQVQNYKSSAIRLAATKKLTGEVLSSEPPGKVRKIARRIMAVNPASELTWDFKLEPGESKTITYKYSVLINR